MTRSALFALAAFLVAPSASAAVEVDPRTGNALIEFTDLSIEGALPHFQLVRSYNSKSVYDGYWGVGWSSNLETRLRVLPEGVAVVHENGGGALTRYHMIKPDPGALNRMIEQMCVEYLKTGTAAGPAGIDAYRQRLTSDAGFREREWMSWSDRVKATDSFAAGTQLVSAKFGYEYLTRTPTGWVRNRSDDIQENFDLSGKLVSLEDRHHNTLEIQYSLSGHPLSMLNNLGRKLTLIFSPDGHVDSVHTDAGISVSYHYDINHDLIGAVPSNAKGSYYSYDGSSRHLLTRIENADGKVESLTYYGLDKNENVQSHLDTLGRTAHYDYSAPSDLKKWASYVLKSPEGNALVSRKTEYVYQTNSAGERWLLRQVDLVDGTRAMTEYNECCVNPVHYNSDVLDIKFEYDSRGRLIRKYSGNRRYEQAYDSKTQKLVRVLEVDTGEGKDRIVQDIRYRYDEKGDLAEVRSGDGEDFRLVFDSSGRLRTLMDRSEERTDFGYNEVSMLLQISQAKRDLAHLVYRERTQPVGVQLSSISGDSDRARILVLQYSLLSIQKLAPQADLSDLLSQLGRTARLRALPK